MKNKLKIEMVPIEQLVAYENNAKLHPGALELEP